MSTKLFFPGSRSQGWFRVGPLACDLDAFATRLAALGYTTGSARQRLRFIRNLSHWMAGRWNRRPRPHATAAPPRGCRDHPQTTKPLPHTPDCLADAPTGSPAAHCTSPGNRRNPTAQPASPQATCDHTCHDGRGGTEPNRREGRPGHLPHAMPAC